MIKRLFDVLVASVSIFILFPFVVTLIVLGKLQFGSPLFFQRRPGLKGKVFSMYKFRSMTDARDDKGALLPDELRLTRYGKLLRASSLDELPELLNVLKGDMSLVGPRPLLEEYLPLYTSEQMRRHDVKPGITGWAQVNGRNELTWDEKFRLDIWYVDNQSVFLDVKILFLTIVKVLSRSGVSHDGASTMPRFEGGQSQDEKNE